MPVEAERVVAVENPLEAEGVEVVLADFYETSLNLDEFDGAAELVEDVLDLGEVLLRVVDEDGPNPSAPAPEEEFCCVEVVSVTL